jgi:hypothetical protein
MARIGRDYLAPDVVPNEELMRDIGVADKGDPGSLLTLALIGASFVAFPHIAKGALKGIGAVGRGVGKGAVGAYKAAMQPGPWKAVGRGAAKAGLAGYEAITGVAKGAGTVLGHISRHPGAYTVGAFGVAAAMGTASAVTTGSPYETAESYVHYGKPGLPADNLGATGDLTLALHNGR